MATGCSFSPAADKTFREVNKNVMCVTIFAGNANPLSFFTGCGMDGKHDMNLPALATEGRIGVWLGNQSSTMRL